MERLKQNPRRSLSDAAERPSSAVTPKDAAGPAKPITVRVKEACRLTGIGRSKFYELIGSGDIPTIKVGSITLIPVAALERFLGID